jgi:hypothetical protein
MLRQEMATPDAAACSLLQRLSEIRMSREVEQAMLALLDDPDPDVVHRAISLLQTYGSAKSRTPLLRHFQLWHARWEHRSADLEKEPYSSRSTLDSAYLAALSSAQGWLTTKEEIQGLRALCVTKQCMESAEQRVIAASSPLMIGFSEPVGDDFEETFGLGIGSMSRLKEKMAQYPKGYTFMLDARSKGHNQTRRVYDQLKPWAVSHGFDLQVYN